MSEGKKIVGIWRTNAVSNGQDGTQWIGLTPGADNEPDNIKSDWACHGCMRQGKVYYKIINQKAGKWGMICKSCSDMRDMIGIMYGNEVKDLFKMIH